MWGVVSRRSPPAGRPGRIHRHRQRQFETGNRFIQKRKTFNGRQKSYQVAQGGAKVGTGEIFVFENRIGIGQLHRIGARGDIGRRNGHDGGLPPFN